MLTWYGVLKLVHVLSVVVWIGGVTAITTISSFLLRTRDRATLAAWLPQQARYGKRIAIPASLLVLISGMAMVAVANVGFKGLWVRLGFVGILLHFLFGVAVMRKRASTFAPLLAASAPDDARIADAGRRMLLSNAIYLLLMASVIAIMVLKPTL